MRSGTVPLVARGQGRAGTLDAMTDTRGMGDFVNAIGQGISGLVGDSLAAIGSVLGGMLGTLGRIVPGGLPIVAVLAVIAIMVGWATFKR